MVVDPEKEIKKLMTKYEALQNINRATWYEWREAAIECARPDVKPIDLVLKAWEVVGHDTAKAYFGMLDVSKPSFIEDIAKCIVMSSTMMGENAKVAVRNVRRDANDKLKKMEKEKDLAEDQAKRTQEKVQDLTDKYVDVIDQMVVQKEKEVMEV